MFGLFKKRKQRRLADFSEEQLVAFTNLISSFLLIQAQSVKGGSGELPESAFSSWSLGYIYGAGDTFLSVADLAPDRDASGVMHGCFGMMLGKDNA